MKLSFRKFIFFLLPILLVLIICSKDNESEKTIKFWAMGAEAEYVTKLVPELKSLILLCQILSEIREVMTIDPYIQRTYNKG